jgi:DNA gyrase subunit A
METNLSLDKALPEYMLPFAKYSIIDRAICWIDGFKPVQRRILYDMHNFGLDKPNATKMKSNKIVGDVMGNYHPHGDSSIYEAMVTMSDHHGGYNIPYVAGKGNWGKCYSSNIQEAASRYTEAALNPLCAEFFDGIKENAVDFKPNYDNTTTEPCLLPVKFPNILVNPNSGIAVGTSANLPSFRLANVCKATQGIITGKIKTTDELAEVLGAPEFPTGGYLHASHESLAKLAETGKGSFVISGRATMYSSKIVIEEIPYNTTAEAVIDSITEAIQKNELKGIADVHNQIDIKGFRLTIELKKGADPRAVLKELYRLTPLRSSISFRTRVIVNDRCEEIGVYRLIEEWVKFRVNCIRRTYNYRIDKAKEKEHLLSTWELIIDDLPNVVHMIASNTEDVARATLQTKYKLDDIQCDYLLDMPIRRITRDRAEKSIKELKDLRAEVARLASILGSEAEIKKIIVKELGEIAEKYGKEEGKVTLTAELQPDDNKPTEVAVSDDVVAIIYTKKGFIKRLFNSSKNYYDTYETDDDVEVSRWTMKNNQYLLVFDRFGYVHKLLADDIDAGRGKLIEELHKKAGLEKRSDIIWADAAGDYSGYFNLMTPDGKGVRIYYDEAKPEGKREKYRVNYDELKPGSFFITRENQFFMMTKKNKAVYRDLTNLGMVSRRSAFNVARVNAGDCFIRLQPISKVPHIDMIDISRYKREYTVAIGLDELWIPDDQLRALRLREKIAREQYEIEKQQQEREQQLAENVEGGEQIPIEDVQDLDTV